MWCQLVNVIQLQKKTIIILFWLSKLEWPTLLNWLEPVNKSFDISATDLRKNLISIIGPMRSKGWVRQFLSWQICAVWGRALSIGGPAGKRLEAKRCFWQTVFSKWTASQRSGEIFEQIFWINQSPHFCPHKFSRSNSLKLEIQNFNFVSGVNW